MKPRRRQPPRRSGGTGAGEGAPHTPPPPAGPRRPGEAAPPPPEVTAAGRGRGLPRGPGGHARARGAVTSLPVVLRAHPAEPGREAAVSDGWGVPGTPTPSRESRGARAGGPAEPGRAEGAERGGAGTGWEAGRGGRASAAVGRVPGELAGALAGCGTAALGHQGDRAPRGSRGRGGIGAVTAVPFPSLVSVRWLLGDACCGSVSARLSPALPAVLALTTETEVLSADRAFRVICGTSDQNSKKQITLVLLAQAVPLLKSTELGAHCEKH
ncbi:circumsporozoite protein-like [Dryobates pubescens]|uniref:circumsporozoite protein-like n=1 Tax=Dryobates pubescens TaxID=118200 RepID=UPI0023B8A903|nr:circumsporozoite protein-like [Dryobates pubescens]